MMALAAQRRNMRVALVDLDLQFGDVDYLAGKEPGSSIRRVALSQLCEQRTLPPTTEGELILVCAPEHPEQGEELLSSIPWLLTELASQCELVVLNTGSFWMDVHAMAVRHCDHIILLMDQRATSVEACKRAIDLCLRLQAPQARLHYLLNGCGRHAALTARDVSLALGGVEVRCLVDGGSLVDELLALGCPLELLESGNAFATSVEDFLDGLTGNRILSTGGPRASRRKAKILDFPLLQGFFEGARHAAP
jgi:pilus assembly protein CpaE